ncbi:MAG: helix-turn-helix domain-containing protein [Bacteroidetes bacterium]|nr:helix-turn-helix domain-containing protein [Bacteroidota bacterium]
MKYISVNIKYLRKKKQLTQDDLALKIGVKRAMIGSYEESRAVPKLPLLQALAYYFDVPLNDLLDKDLSKITDSKNHISKIDLEGNNLRVLSTIVDKQNNELMTVVPAKAAAGYLNGYADVEFVESLTAFSLPLAEISHDRTYRIFQIKGDSMEPLPTGTYIICRYLDNWYNIKDGKTYVVLTKDDGIVYKRLYNRLEETKTLEMISDNHLYPPFSVHIENVLEVWQAIGLISFQLPDSDVPSLFKLNTMFTELKNEINTLKKAIG